MHVSTLGKLSTLVAVLSPVISAAVLPQDRVAARFIFQVLEDPVVYRTRYMSQGCNSPQIQQDMERYFMCCHPLMKNQSDSWFPELCNSTALLNSSASATGPSTNVNGTFVVPLNTDMPTSTTLSSDFNATSTMFTNPSVTGSFDNSSTGTDFPMTSFSATSISSTDLPTPSPIDGQSIDGDGTTPVPDGGPMLTTVTVTVMSGTSLSLSTTVFPISSGPISQSPNPSESSSGAEDLPAPSPTDSSDGPSSNADSISATDTGPTFGGNSGSASVPVTTQPTPSLDASSDATSTSELEEPSTLNSTSVLTLSSNSETFLQTMTVTESMTVSDAVTPSTGDSLDASPTSTGLTALITEVVTVTSTISASDRDTASFSTSSSADDEASMISSAMPTATDFSVDSPVAPDASFSNPTAITITMTSTFTSSPLPSNGALDASSMATLPSASQADDDSNDSSKIDSLPTSTDASTDSTSTAGETPLTSVPSPQVDSLASTLSQGLPSSVAAADSTDDSTPTTFASLNDADALAPTNTAADIQSSFPSPSVTGSVNDVPTGSSTPPSSAPSDLGNNSISNAGGSPTQTDTSDLQATSTGSNATTTTTGSPTNSPSNSTADGNFITGGQATFFFQEGAKGACGDVHSDSDFICAMSTERFGKTSPCGKKVQITNTNNGKSVTVTVADECPGCAMNSIDLSIGAFTAIATEEEGTVPIKWQFAA